MPLEAGSNTTCGSIDEFKEAFDACFPTVGAALKGMDEGIRAAMAGGHRSRDLNWFIAGGAVLRALLYHDEPNRACFGKSNDVDIFIYGCGASEEDSEEATRFAKDIFESIKAAFCSNAQVSRSQHVININFEVDTEREWVDVQSVDVQIILRLYHSPAEVLLGFDCDPCCVGFDGKSVWALPRALRALRTGRTVLNPLHAWPNRPAYELRLAKYAARGFPVAIPGLQSSHIPALGGFNATALTELRGLARLLHVHLKLTDVMVTGDPTSGVRAPDKLGVMIDNEDYEEADAEGDVEREALAAYRGTMKAELVRAEAKDGDDGVGRAIGCRVDPQELLRRLFGECSVAVSYGSERCTLIKVLPTDDDCDRKIDAFNCEENFEGALDSVLEKRPGTSSWKERNVPGTGPSSNFDDILDAGDVVGLQLGQTRTQSCTWRAVRWALCACLRLLVPPMRPSYAFLLCLPPMPPQPQLLAALTTCCCLPHLATHCLAAGGPAHRPLSHLDDGAAFARVPQRQG